MHACIYPGTSLGLGTGPAFMGSVSTSRFDEGGMKCTSWLKERYWRALVQTSTGPKPRAASDAEPYLGHSVPRASKPSSMRVGPGLCIAIQDLLFPISYFHFHARRPIIRAVNPASLRSSPRGSSLVSILDIHKA
jgi:hypothetical protein